MRQARGLCERQRAGLSDRPGSRRAQAAAVAAGGVPERLGIGRGVGRRRDAGRAQSRVVCRRRREGGERVAVVVGGESVVVEAWWLQRRRVRMWQTASAVAVAGVG
jgi:hypothetical protein